MWRSYSFQRESIGCYGVLHGVCGVCASGIDRLRNLNLLQIIHNFTHFMTTFGANSQVSPRALMHSEKNTY